MILEIILPAGIIASDAVANDPGRPTYESNCVTGSPSFNPQLLVIDIDAHIVTALDFTSV